MTRRMEHYQQGHAHGKSVYHYECAYCGWVLAWKWPLKREPVGGFKKKYDLLCDCKFKRVRRDGFTATLLVCPHGCPTDELNFLGILALVPIRRVRNLRKREATA